MAPLNCESNLHSTDSSSTTSTTIDHTVNNNNNESMQDSPKPLSNSSSFEKSTETSNEEDVNTGEEKTVSPDTDENGANTNFTHTFLKSILSSIDSKDPVVANAWLETLLDVIDLLSKEIIREEVLPVAVAKSQLQEVSAKIASCKLIGKLSNKFEPNVLRQELSGSVQSLCQDVSPEVRSGICEVLATVAIGLGLDTTKSLILPELVNLCSDEHISVRAGALNALVDMLPILDSSTRCDTIIPLVKKVCEGSLNNKDSCLPLCAHLLGPLCHTLQGDMSSEDKKCLLDFYSKMSVIGSAKDSGEKPTELPEAPPTDTNPSSPTLNRLEGDCREQCAFNYPGMLIFTLGVPLSAITLAGSPGGEFLPPSPLDNCDSSLSSGDTSPLKETLIPILCSLAADSSIPVRVVVAKSFHQICLILGAEAILLRDALLTLLHSESLEVLSALLPSLPMVLQMLHTHHVTPTGSKEEMVSVLLRLEDRVSASCGGVWRTHADVLHHMSRLVTFLPHTIVSEQLIPRMRQRMASARALPCRVSAARTLLVYFQHLPEGEKQQQVANSIVKEFCQSSSCHHRMLYLTVCGLCVELLPHQIFKSYFSTSMIAMHADRVPNIRLRLVSLLPLVKASLQLPADKTLLQSLETAVGSLLLTETDKDVCSAVSRIIVDLENISLKGSIERTTPEGIETITSYSEDISTQSDITEVSGSSSNSSQKTISYPKEGSKIAKKFDSTDEGNKNSLPTFIPKKKKDSSIPSPQTSKMKSPSTPSRNSVLRSSGRRAAGACNLPSYVGARRLSAVLPPPKLPPDKSTVMRLSSLDPTTDEFLVDAGIRIDESALRSRLPTPHSSRNIYSSDFVSIPSNRIQRPIGGSRLRPPTPSSHMSKLSVDSLCGNMSPEQSSFTRSRAGSGRNPRPVSTSDGTCSTNVPSTSRTKSLSHENLRLAPHSGSHITNDSIPGSKNSLGNRNETSPSNASRSPSSRLTYTSNKPTSCSSSPGASRCTSPGIPISSPPSSRCSSPGGTIVRMGGMGSARTNKSAFVPVSSFSSHKSPSDSVSPTTPPSPAPQGRSSSSGSQMNSNRRSNNSRLPLPTHRHR